MDFKIFGIVIMILGILTYSAMSARNGQRRTKQGATASQELYARNVMIRHGISRRTRVVIDQIISR